ncbi:MAG: class I SAM-dependent methyltransferase [Actinomycetia bacterium]|nr:class I SAM-dependent methyltransferase [Actinomycetes bacterium]MCP3913221.1 class I SAM-dependent methyltransferase [Actinomycetes bacterium]MCP4084925.1 class I SAM-dependent methyltransferase [Actinomycetes bacterium]
MEPPVNEPPVRPSAGQTHPAAFPEGADPSADAVQYGPDIPDESTLRLLGDPQGRRLVVLGSGGLNPIVLAKAGARVIVVDPRPDSLERTRLAARQAEVNVEVNEAALHALAFLRADSVDAVVSAYGLTTVEDLGRVFRQVHRILRHQSQFVFSLPHPASALLDTNSPDPLRLVRSWFDNSVRSWTSDGEDSHDRPRSHGELVTGLSRAGFVVDAMHEPEPTVSGMHSRLWSDTFRWVPPTLVVRARKQGS